MGADVTPGNKHRGPDKRTGQGVGSIHAMKAKDVFTIAIGAAIGFFTVEVVKEIFRRLRPQQGGF
jgi:hypothetical protein